MKTYIALLRGINVGGHNRLKMADLKAICARLGLENARTYLQSGNVVFEAKERDAAKVAKRLAEAIHGATGLEIAVIVRRPEEVARALAGNPFAEAVEAEPNRLFVTFLDREPARAAAEAFLAWHKGPEPVRLAGTHLYVHYPSGAGDSKLTNAVIEKKLGVVATARNWNTVRALVEMTSQPKRPA